MQKLCLSRKLGEITVFFGSIFHEFIYFSDFSLRLLVHGTMADMATMFWPDLSDSATFTIASVMSQYSLCKDKSFGPVWKI